MIFKTAKLPYSKQLEMVYKSNEQQTIENAKQYCEGHRNTIESTRLENIAQNYKSKHPTEKRSVMQFIEAATKPSCEARILMKDPKKQNFYELLAYQYLQEYVNIIEKNIRNHKISIELEQLSKNSMYFHNNDILRNCDISGDRDNRIKSVDFRITICIDDIKHSVFMLHKYTDKKGGSQDHQFNEAKLFIEYAKNIKNIKHKEHRHFLAITDGKYYDELFENRNDETLNLNSRTHHVRIEEVMYYISLIINKETNLEIQEILDTNEYQHKLGQYYSSNTDLLKSYKSDLQKNNKIVYDPYVGEGHLIDYMLSIFTKDIAREKILNGEIYGTDIDESNIKYCINYFSKKYEIKKKKLQKYFFVNDSLLNVPKVLKNKDLYILTNPPYLARNSCSKSGHISEYNRYFSGTIYNDYYEIALNIFGQYDGIWIIPNNFLSADRMNNLRKKILNKKNISDVYVYERSMFEDTAIPVLTMKLSELQYNTNGHNNIYFKPGNKLINIDISSIDGKVCSEWQNISNYKNSLGVSHGLIEKNITKGDVETYFVDSTNGYKNKKMFISTAQKQYLDSQILYLRAVDTGGKDGFIGLYTIDELYPNKNNISSMITKISSRLYTPIFFKNVDVDVQIKIKNMFNNKLKKLRLTYNSIFLTDFKGATENGIRKRIGFKQAIALINYIYSENIQTSQFDVLFEIQ